MDSREVLSRVIETFSSAIDNRSSYHHQKELMAWTATALYVPTILILAREVAPLMGWWTLLPIIPVAVGAFVFINMQFAMRWSAADQYRCLTRARSRLIATVAQRTNISGSAEPTPPGDRPIDAAQSDIPASLQLPDTWNDISKERDFPCIVETEIDELHARQPRFSWAPRSWDVKSSRWRSEFASYFVLLTVTVTGSLAPLAYPHNSQTESKEQAKQTAQTASLNGPAQPNIFQTLFMVFFAIFWGAVANVQPRWKAFHFGLWRLPHVKKRILLSAVLLNLFPLLFFVYAFWVLSHPDRLSSAFVPLRLAIAGILPAFSIFGFYRLWLGIIEFMPDRFYVETTKSGTLDDKYRHVEPTYRRSSTEIPAHSGPIVDIGTDSALPNMIWAAIYIVTAASAPWVA